MEDGVPYAGDERQRAQLIRVPPPEVGCNHKHNEQNPAAKSNQFDTQARNHKTQIVRSHRISLCAHSVMLRVIFEVESKKSM
jgi:hypothetical protein